MVTRIRQLLDTKQFTPTQFADFIGVGRPVMSHILSERNKPSLEVVQRIISAFPDVSLPWLLSGIGEMMAEANSAALTAPPTSEAAPVGLSAPAATVGEEPIGVSSPAEPALEQSEPQLLSTAPVSPAKQPKEPTEAAPPAPAVITAPAQVVPAPTPPASVVLPIPAQPASAPRHAAPQAFPAGLQAATPIAASASDTPPASVAPQPFRAGRFVPAAAKVSSSATPRKAAGAGLPSPAAFAAAPALPVADKAATSLSTVPAAGKPSAEAALLPFFGEPGKEIRRIVIFYRDGSFADYQPEA